MSGFWVTLRDPSLRGGAAIPSHFDDRAEAVEHYRDQLATMWRRPGGSLELEADGAILASFPGKEAP